MFFFKCLLVAGAASVSIAITVAILSGSLEAAVWTQMGVRSLLSFAYLLHIGQTQEKADTEVRLDHYP